MSSPARFTKGVTNVDSANTMGQLIIPDPTSCFVWMQDFDKYDPGEWFITRIKSLNVTVGSETVSDASNGILAVTASAGDDDSVFFQWKGYSNVSTASEIFTLESTKKLWFKSKFKVSNTGDSDFIIGLQSADTTPLTSPVDSVIWKSDDGDDYADFQIYKGSAASLNDTAIATMVDDTYVTVGFYWDGVDTIQYFYNDLLQGSNTADNPTAAMSPIFGVQNGSAAARIMTVDFICVVKER